MIKKILVYLTVILLQNLDWIINEFNILVINILNELIKY
jgi:hypothetical protein